MVHIKFVVNKTLISSIYTKTVSLIISEIFDKIRSAPPTFTPSKKMQVKYFSENYKFYYTLCQNFIEIGDSSLSQTSKSLFNALSRKRGRNLSAITRKVKRNVVRQKCFSDGIE